MIEFDVETNGTQWYADARPFVVSFYSPESLGPDALVIPIGERERIQAILDMDEDFRAWNSKFDLHMLEAAGFRLPPPERWHDGMVKAALLDENKSKALKARAEAMFGESERGPEKAIKEWIKAENKERKARSKETGERFVGATYADVPDELMHPYAAQDVLLTRRIGDLQDTAIDRSPELTELYSTEMVVMQALYAAEAHGLPMDEAAAFALEMELAMELEAIEDAARALAGFRNFNPNSTQQLAEALERRGADLSFVGKTDGGKLSMDAENLATVDDELARKVEEFRATSKILGTYVRPMLHETQQSGEIFNYTRQPYIQDGRLHTSFNQTAAVTGRMSSSDPNIQNLPRDDLRIRYLVHAEPGYKLVTADLDSIEMVLFGAYAGDGPIQRAVREGRTKQLHTMTADAVGLGDFTRAGGAVESKHQRGKTFNYSMLYGAGVRSIRKHFRVPKTRAQEMIDLYHAAYPEVGMLQRLIEYKLYERGYVKSAYGRRFHVKPRDAYKAVNYLIQGTAADMLKVSIARLHKQGVPLIAAVHDELIAHVPEKDAEEVAHLIQEALTDHPRITEKVPLGAEAQIVDRWSDAKKPGYVPEFIQRQKEAA